MAYESVCVLRSKSEYGVMIKYSLPFVHKICHVFFVPSVTDISWHGWAIQGSSRVMINDLNKNINVLMEIVTSLALIE